MSRTIKSLTASTDALTGLMTRRAFELHLDEAIVAARGDARHVFCPLAIDRFQAVNDEFGHAAGDAVLQHVASLIKHTVHATDMVARIGGNDFGILLLDCTTERASQITEDIVGAVREQPAIWQGRSCPISVSVGMVQIRGENSLIAIVCAAECALYDAKTRGGNRCVDYGVFDEVTEQQRSDLLWLDRIQTGFKSGLELYAHPMTAAAHENTEEGTDVEVELRLRDEDGASHSLSDFRDSAGRLRLMPRLDHWVVHHALTAVAGGAVRLAPNAKIRIPLSRQTLSNMDFLPYIVECLARDGLEASRVCFVVPSIKLSPGSDCAQEFVRELQGKGCAFAQSNSDGDL